MVGNSKGYTHIAQHPPIASSILIKDLWETVLLELNNHGCFLPKKIDHGQFTTLFFQPIYYLAKQLYITTVFRYNLWHDQGNESDVGNIDFELQAQKGDKFLYFSLFLTFKECSYLRNQMSD